jgi:hypothetical protein
MTPDSAHVDDRLLDLLVDGELAEPERRVLLARLEAEPDGWRRCALAFLEAQCWRDASRSLADLARSAPGKPLVDPWDGEGLATWPRPRQPIGPLAGWAGIAAGLIAAFSLGIAASSALRIAPAKNTAVGLQSQPAGAPAAATSSPPTRHIKEPVPVDRGRTFALVRLGQNGSSVTEVPILEGTGFDEEWLDPRSHALPESLVSQWNQEGFQVEKRSRLVSMGLPGGQRVAIPLEEVKLHFVGKPTY